MNNNYEEKGCHEAWNEIMHGLLMLCNSLYETKSLQAYVSAAVRIIRPLESDMTALDKLRKEEREKYMLHLVRDYEDQIDGGVKNE